MKKTIVLLTTVLISSTATAQIGLTVGFGYQINEVANSADRDGDPAGFSIDFHYAIPGVEGLFVALDVVDHEDDADASGTDTLTTKQERTALKVGYMFPVDDSTSLIATIYNADIDWEWKDGRATNFNRFESSDSGISAVIGVDKNLGNGTSLGTAFSLGFETGLEVYTSIKIIDNLDVKMSFYKNSYELEFAEFDETGSTGNGTAFGDGEFQFDTSGFRVSARYSF